MRVAIITGGTRGIGRGISETLAASGQYDGLLLTYNTNLEAAEAFKATLGGIKVELVGGDLTTQEARDAIFECIDKEFCEFDVATVVHNAGQYIGVTSDNVDGIKAGTRKFGDGSLLKEDGKLDTTYLEYYQQLYGTAFVDICERSIDRMKKAHARCQEAKAGQKYRGSIVGISSPGCNTSFKITPGYDMPGSGKCMMEYAIRLYAANVAEFGINCNVIIPGVTRSDAWGKIAEQRGFTADGFLESFVAKAVPAKEVIEATDIGDTVKFLAGPGGGRFMTGLSLRVDGGLHLQ
jgi:3-oxoacyl-[acyl-carrier protein] reductase